MRNLQERKRIRQILYSPVLSFALLIILAMVLNGVYGVYKKDQIASSNRIDADKKLASLKDRRDRLGGEIAKLNTDRGIEEELRNKFQITKKGEGVLILVDDTSANIMPELHKSNKGLLGKMLELIGF